MKNNYWHKSNMPQAIIGLGILAFLAIGFVLLYYILVSTPENRFIYAASNGDIPTIEFLVQKGVSVNARDSEVGTTALMSAIESHQENTVQFLLDEGADVNLSDINGETALMSASLKGETKVVAALLKRGAKVNVANNETETALLYAVVNGHADIVKLLIKNGADVTKKYSVSGIAFHENLWDIAGDQNRNDIASLLRSADALESTAARTR